MGQVWNDAMRHALRTFGGLPVPADANRYIQPESRPL
jgi:hypothetical protein